MGTPLPPPKMGGGVTAPPIFAHVLWRNGCMDQDATWYGVGLGPGHIVLHKLYPLKGAQQPPMFGPCLFWPNGWMAQDGIWYGGRPRPLSHCVSWGPSPKWAQPPPQFSAHVCVGQTAAWIKIPLGTEVGLDPDDIVLNGDQAPPENGAQQPPLLGPCLLWRNGWMDQDATWYGGRSRPRPHCVRWGQPPGKGHSSPAPCLRPMSIVAKRSPVLSQC